MYISVGISILPANLDSQPKYTLSMAPHPPQIHNRNYSQEQIKSEPTFVSRFIHYISYHYIYTQVHQCYLK